MDNTMNEQNYQAPYVSPITINTLMESLRFESWIVPGTTETIVVSILPNGFTVAKGSSACVSKENFDAEIGIKYAMEDCIKVSREKLWELEGYHLRKCLDDKIGGKTCH